MCTGNGYPRLFLQFFSGMQSFFIATEHFSVQNVRMQEKKAESKGSFVKRIGLTNLICMVMFCGMVAIVLGAILYTYRNIPLSNWREYCTGLPMTGHGIEVEELQAEWKSSAGNKRLELRTAYYPQLRIKLGKGNGSGIIFAKFINSRRAVQGATLALHYREGNFLPVKDYNIQAEGKNGVLLLEKGFTKAADYKLHQLNEEESLWSVQIFQRSSENNTTYYLGSCTISPTAE